jgi:hypothetical protein
LGWRARTALAGTGWLAADVDGVGAVAPAKVDGGSALGTVDVIGVIGVLSVELSTEVTVGGSSAVVAGGEGVEVGIGCGFAAAPQLASVAVTKAPKAVWRSIRRVTGDGVGGRWGGVIGSADSGDPIRESRRHAASRFRKRFPERKPIKAYPAREPVGLRD